MRENDIMWPSDKNPNMYLTRDDDYGDDAPSGIGLTRKYLDGIIGKKEFIEKIKEEIPLIVKEFYSLDTFSPAWNIQSACEDPNLSLQQKEKLLDAFDAILYTKDEKVRDKVWDLAYDTDGQFPIVHQGEYKGELLQVGDESVVFPGFTVHPTDSAVWAAHAILGLAKRNPKAIQKIYENKRNRILDDYNIFYSGGFFQALKIEAERVGEMVELAHKRDKERQEGRYDVNVEMEKAKAKVYKSIMGRHSSRDISHGIKMTEKSGYKHLTQKDREKLFPLHFRNKKKLRE